MRIVIACLVAASTVAYAAEDHEAKRAQDYLKAGIGRFDKQLYKEALATFKRGYEHKPEAIFHFHFGQCHRMLGSSAEAIKEYREYLAKAPDANDRDVVTKYIADLEPGGSAVAVAKPVVVEKAVVVEKPVVVEKAAPPVKPAPAAPVAATSEKPPIKEKLLVLADEDEAPVKVAANERPASPSPPSPDVPTVVKPPVDDGAGAAPAIAVTANEGAPKEKLLAPSDALAPPDEGTPLHKKWWLWTIFGVVVVGGVATGLGVGLSHADAPIPTDLTGGFHAVSF